MLTSYFGETPSQTAQEVAGTQGQVQPKKVPAQGKTYYVHGNKASKAVCEYYNHLILNNYTESLDENGEPKQETAKEQGQKKSRHGWRAGGSGQGVEY